MDISIFVVMFKNNLLFLCMLVFSGIIPAQGQRPHAYVSADMRMSPQDSAVYDQMLINGRLWRGTFYQISGTECLFTDDWLDADITISGRYFDGIKLKYDIVNDEIMFPSYKTNTIVVLNKNQVTRFGLHYNSREFEFVKSGEGDARTDGYMQLIYSGGTRLYKKWKKRVVVNQARLNQEFKVEGVLFLEKDGSFHKISKKSSLMSLFKENKKELKNSIREAHIRIDIDRPQSIVPLLEIVDSRNFK